MSAMILAGLRLQYDLASENLQNYYLHEQLKATSVQLMTILCLFNQLILDRAGLVWFFFLNLVVHHPSEKQE